MSSVPQPPVCTARSTRSRLPITGTSPPSSPCRSFAAWRTRMPFVRQVRDEAQVRNSAQLPAPARRAYPAHRRASHPTPPRGRTGSRNPFQPRRYPSDSRRDREQRHSRRRATSHAGSELRRRTLTPSAHQDERTIRNLPVEPTTSTSAVHAQPAKQSSANAPEAILQSTMREHTTTVSKTPSTATQESAHLQPVLAHSVSAQATSPLSPTASQITGKSERRPDISVHIGTIEVRVPAPPARSPRPAPAALNPRNTQHARFRPRLRTTLPQPGLEPRTGTGVTSWPGALTICPLSPSCSSTS